MKVLIQTPPLPDKEIPAGDLPPGTVGIITRIDTNITSGGSHLLGRPVVNAVNALAFLDGSWSSSVKGYYCRRLRPGERITILESE